jgi:hypothetical protein
MTLDNDAPLLRPISRSIAGKFMTIPQVVAFIIDASRIAA